MAKIIAVTNQKGGVGKTTTTINLAAYLVDTKQRVLLVDFDPQGNATMGSGVDKNTLACSINDVLLYQQPIKSAILTTRAGYDLLPANQDLTESEVGLLAKDQQESFLKQQLQNLQDDYDYMFIDCPLSLNTLTVNALVAACSVLIPVQCEYYALEGLASLVSTIEQIKQTVNSKLEIEGLLRTMYDGRNRLTQDVSEQLLTYFPDKVYRTVVPRNVRLAEAPSHGLSIREYAKDSQGAAAYLILAGEFLRKQASNQVTTE